MTDTGLRSASSSWLTQADTEDSWVTSFEDDSTIVSVESFGRDNIRLFSGHTIYSLYALDEFTFVGLLTYNQRPGYASVKDVIVSFFILFS